MQVFVTVANETSGERRDLVVRAPADASFESFLGALGVPGSSWASDRAISGESPLGDVLREGVLLTPSQAPATTPTSAAVLELGVVGGPDSGLTWSLPPGTYTIGRSVTAALTLPSDDQIFRHHATITISESGLTIHDHDSVNGILVGGAFIKEGSIAQLTPFQLGETILMWSSPRRSSPTLAPDGDGGLVFNRPPRMLPKQTAARVVVPSSPTKPQRNPFPLIGIVAPIVIGVAMAVLLKRPEFLLFTVLSPIMVVSNFVTDRRRGKRSHRARAAQYKDQREQAETAVAAAVAREAAERRAAAPDPVEVAAIAVGPQLRLWERRRGDDDYLRLRIGLTDAAAELEIARTPKVASDGDPEDEIAQPLLHQVPAAASLTDVRILGLAGPRDRICSLATWLVVQMAVFHPPEQTRLAILCSDDSEASWAWARWLPHLRSTNGQYVARIGNTETSRNSIALELSNLIEQRLQDRESRSSQPGNVDPVYVVVLDGAYGLSANPAIARVLKNGPDVGIFAICLDEAEHLLPEECRGVATLAAEQPTRVAFHISSQGSVTNVLGDFVRPDWAEAVARSLAPLRLARKAEATAALPTGLRLLELLRLDPPSPVDILSGWREGGGRTTSCVVGVGLGGPLIIDLVRDGPHSLVAGTTGSGKSEFLQTLIGSLAAVNRPDSLSFVLIDYKGGSAFKECAELPHTVGMVSDLDGHLTERALTSLSAEIRRREVLFNEHRTRNIEEYWQLPESSVPILPRLLLVIDEFAVLAEELPTFVEGLVDLARRGRSLGVHLILATQRPSGVVSPSIRANSNLRLALRVTDPADSIDVIDSPLAARISRENAGRGYLRSGHGQVIEFQSGRVGGPAPSVSDDSETQVAVADCSWAALGEPLSFPVSEATSSDTTDLTLLVTAIAAAVERDGLEVPASPWLEPLPEVVNLAEIAASPADDRRKLEVVYGLEDLPQLQTQVPAVFDLEQQSHLLVIGDAGSGRSSFLRTFAASMAQSVPVDHVHLYGIDCGNGALLPLSELPHCGAIVTRSEADRVERMVDRLLAEIDRRQKVFSERGFSGIVDQRASGDHPLPYVVVLLDRWEGFTAAFESVDGGRILTSFLHALREAPGVGVRFVITGDRSAFSARLASLVEDVAVLRLNDRNGYSLAGLNPRSLPDRIPPGRAFRSQNGSEIQVALLGRDPAGPAQIAQLKQLAERARDRDAAVPEADRPAPIAVLPQRVLLEGIELDHRDSALPLFVGVGGDRLVQQWLDLGADGPGFVVGGPPRSGRSSTLQTMAAVLLSRGVQLVVVTSRPSPLSRLTSTPGVIAVVHGPGASTEEFDRLMAGLLGPTVVMVDDAEQLADAPIAQPLAAFARTARDLGHGFIAAGVAADLASGFRGFMPEVRKSRAGILLCPDNLADGELLGLRLPRTALFNGPPGRGILAVKGATCLVQVPLGRPEA